MRRSPIVRQHPEFTSDRMRMLAPLITPLIIEIARERILSGDSFYKNDKLVRSDLSKGELKLVLIVVREMNPWEYLDTNEQAALRSMGRGSVQREGEGWSIDPVVSLKDYEK